MAKRVLMGIEETRRSLGERIKNAEATGEQTIVTRHGKPVVVIVSVDWMRRAAEALGEPTDL